jgi:plasmid stabilization system protein ParE
LAQTQIIWSDRAIADLQGIRAYIAQFNPAAAARIAAQLIAAAESLSTLPDRGRPVGPNRRELATLWPYVIQYRRTGSRVDIVRVQHGRQRRSRHF